MTGSLIKKAGEKNPNCQAKTESKTGKGQARHRQYIRGTDKGQKSKILKRVEKPE